MNVINKLNAEFKNNKVYYFMVLIFLCVGIALGAMTVKYMNTTDTTDLSNYFLKFAKNIASEPIIEKTLFLQVLKKNIILISIIIIFTFTIFGIPIILLVDLIKGFTFGYSFTFLFSTFGGKGFWLALAATIPQNLLYIPCFIALSIIGIEFSSTKLRVRFFNKGNVNRIVEKEIIFKIGVLLCIFFIGTIVETYISTNLIKLVLTNIYNLS